MCPDISRMWEKSEQRGRTISASTSRVTDITLSAVSSNIHNNDCRKFYGTVSLSVWITDASGRRTIEISPVSGGGTLLNWERGPARNVINFPGAGVTAPNLENISSVYNIDQTLLDQNRIVFSITTNLGSAHKGCDLCTDHTWEARMPTRQEQVFSLRGTLNQPGTVKQAITGPFRTTDNRHDIRVHFEVR